MKNLQFRAWDYFNGEMFFSKARTMSHFWREVEDRREGGNLVEVTIQCFKDRDNNAGYEGDIVEQERHVFDERETPYDGTGRVAMYPSCGLCIHVFTGGRMPLIQARCRIIGNVHQPPTQGVKS